MELGQIYFNRNDFDNFRAWLPLNYAGLTWQGRYQKEFDEFWELFFSDGISLFQLIERFRLVQSEVNIGPLASWLNWLQEKFTAYVFIHMGPSTRELAEASEISIGSIAMVLRDFFLEHFPHLEERLSEFFLVSSVIDKHVNLTYLQLAQHLNLNQKINGGYEEEIMTSMEVTLYEEWSYLLKRLNKLTGKPEEFKKLVRKRILMDQVSVFRDVVVLVVLVIGITFVLKKANVYYEKYLADKIKIYEPQFKWLNKNLSFQENEPIDPQAKLAFDIKDIESVEEENTKFVDIDEAERSDVESDVVLTSWDTLPKDFGVVNLEQSDYEEMLQKGGYRESQYGETKVYRVMMKSEDTSSTKGKLNQLLDRYKVTQVDNVKPGMPVPGGVYYNLFVPREFLKEFMAQVTSVDEAVIYESRTKSQKNPVGKNRVFIWVKSI